MNPQPYQTSPRWWSSRLSHAWVRMSRPLRRIRGRWEHGLNGIEVRGLEHVREAMQARQGVLIAPNHPSHADPYVILEAGDRLGVPFHFMTAWQVFAMTHGLGRQVLRRFGCFSVNREGNDLRAVRHGIRLLERPSKPLVIFPEGEVYHLNDKVMPLRKGAVSTAVLAARKSGRPVSIVPSALKFIYTEDPEVELARGMTRLEQAAGISPSNDTSLLRRIRRFADVVVENKEIECLGLRQPGSLQTRITNLVEAILSRTEDTYGVVQDGRTVGERIKRLRFRAIRIVELLPDDHPDAGHARQAIKDLFLATQLYSYPVDYLSGNPSIERIAETIDKLEEDVFRLHRAPIRGLRRAVVLFGEPLVIEPHFERRKVVQQLTDRLRYQIQDLVDEVGFQPFSPSAQEPSCGSWNHPPMQIPQVLSA